MKTSPLYFDFNATTPLRAGVKQIMQETFEFFGNPSSVHSLGCQARTYIERARYNLADFIQAQPEDIVFTSCGSEANNTILKHYLANGAKIFVSAIEHACVLQAAPEAEKLPVTPEGYVDVTYLKTRLKETRQSFQGPILVAVMYVNNETGVIQPIDEIVELAKSYRAYVHCDAVQALGKKKIDYGKCGVDSLTFSAHKIGGPKGIGAYIAKPHLKITPLIHGGGQERGNRSGTENVSGIAGFGAALEECTSDDWTGIEKLRNYFETQLQKRIPDLHIYGFKSARIHNTSYFSIPGFSDPLQVIAFDLEKICVGSGSACSSGKSKPSHVLKAMGYTDQEASHAIRVSFGWTTTQQEVDYLIDACERIYLRHSKGKMSS